ncbi:MAG: cyclic lactone autoinducer peptide [Lachnospiraceae bacterium]|nr:cyclic lactone autoinducer peptide [Lachnospiraceae bacterium]
MRRKIVLKLANLLGVVAIAITSYSVNQTCMFWAYQPELPKGADKLKNENI